MRTVKKNAWDIRQTLGIGRGYVRYYDTTEPLDELVDMAGVKPSSRVLACCGGGNQALTFLGCVNERGRVFAFDHNPAQLFVLAAKAAYLARRTRKPFLPSFDRLTGDYPGKIHRLSKDLRIIEELYDRQRKKYVSVPDILKLRFAMVADGGTYVCDRHKPFWADNKAFCATVRSHLTNLRFISSDIFYLDEFFDKDSLDLIYVSDICFLDSTAFFLERMKRIVRLLKKGGVILGHADRGNHLTFGPTVIETLQSRPAFFGLKAFREKNRLRVLKKN